MRFSKVLVSILIFLSPFAAPGPVAAQSPDCDHTRSAGAPECGPLGNILRGLESLTDDLTLNLDSPDADIPRSATVAPIASGEGAVSIRASRIFSGPTQYPPADFAAYGIVAFPSRATSADHARHVMICEAYVATLPSTAELATPRAEQMVTVWPVMTDAEGDRLTATPPENLCDAAVDAYNLLNGQRSIRLAEQAGARLGEGRGPYLLAWSPGELLGTRDAHTLRMDMSQVSTHEQAVRFFRRWVDDIEQNPELWRQGWNLESMRLLLQAWANEMGERILSF